MMNSRAGQASTLTKTRVVASRQESFSAKIPSFTIQATWPPRVVGNPLVGPKKPLSQPSVAPNTPDPSPQVNPSEPQQQPDPANPETI